MDEEIVEEISEREYKKIEKALSKYEWGSTLAPILKEMGVKKVKKVYVDSDEDTGIIYDVRIYADDTELGTYPSSGQSETWDILWVSNKDFDSEIPFGRKTWNSTDENLKRRVWKCNRKYEKKGEVSCNNKHIDEEFLYKAFVSSFNALVENKEEFIKKWKSEDGNELKKYKAKEFINTIESEERIEEFDIDLYFKVIEKMTIYEDRVIVAMLEGTEVECQI